MALDRKTFFIEELKRHFQGDVASARAAEVDAAKAADEVRKQARNKDDAKAAVDPGRMANGQLWIVGLERAHADDHGIH